MQKQDIHIQVLVIEVYKEGAPEEALVAQVGPGDADGGLGGNTPDLLLGLLMALPLIPLGILGVGVGFSHTPTQVVQLLVDGIRAGMLHIGQEIGPLGVGIGIEEIVEISQFSG